MKVTNAKEFKRYMINFWFNKYIPLQEENKELKKQIKEERKQFEKKLKECEKEVVRYRDMAASLSKQKQRLQQKLVRR